MKDVLAGIGAGVVICAIIVGLIYLAAFLSTVWYWRWGKGARALRELRKAP